MKKMKAHRFQEISNSLYQPLSQSQLFQLVQELLGYVEVEPGLPASKLIQGVREQYRTKGKLEAVKWYKAMTGVSLMEAKQSVERIVPDKPLPNRAAMQPTYPAQFKGVPGFIAPVALEKKKGKTKKSKQRTKVRLRHRTAPGKK